MAFVSTPHLRLPGSSTPPISYHLSPHDSHGPSAGLPLDCHGRRAAPGGTPVRRGRRQRVPLERSPSSQAAADSGVKLAHLAKVLKVLNFSEAGKGNNFT